jgi:serine phosphatase RsbU (regulator of sigma subunit)
MKGRDKEIERLERRISELIEQRDYYDQRRRDAMQKAEEYRRKWQEAENRNIDTVSADNVENLAKSVRLLRSAVEDLKRSIEWKNSTK